MFLSSDEASSIAGMDVDGRDADGVRDTPGQVNL